MEQDLKISIENGVGIICLTRPKALNALTPDMVVRIRQTLLHWSDDPGVRLVLFEGEGEKGFCAGGDVRWTRNAMLQGQRKEAFGFFAVEYEMNRLIAKYDKPIVALTHGVVMGGGLGIAGHARYRIATNDARFAMPEAAIGFFCDVGMRSLLARVERHRALIFMLSGNLVGLGDAIALGLSDVGIDKSDFCKVRAGIIATGAIDDVEGEIKNVISRFRIEPSNADICQLADRAEAVFQGEDYATIIAKLKVQDGGESALTEIAHIIASRCPTSNFVHVAGLDAARQNGDIHKVLDADLRLAHFMAKREDFVEGVRAVLVDKDHTPKWVPTRIEDVEVDLIRGILLQE